MERIEMLTRLAKMIHALRNPSNIEHIAEESISIDKAAVVNILEEYAHLNGFKDAKTMERVLQRYSELLGPKDRARDSNYGVLGR